MKPTDFEIKDNTNGNDWPITYYKSHLVPAKLHKFNDMGWFKQVGQLTSVGIAFVTSIIKDLTLYTWDEYRSQIKTAHSNLISLNDILK